MPRSKPIALSEVEREVVDEDKVDEGEYREAVSRISRAIPILAQVSERLAKRDEVVAHLPKWNQFQETTDFFIDNYDGSVFDWLAFDPGKVEGYSCQFYTLTKT